MTVIVVRHALSEANNRDNIGTMAFGATDAPLMPQGVDQARAAAVNLPSYGVDASREPVAVSTLLRTWQTAEVLGFSSIRQDPLLDEVEHGMDGRDLRALLDSGGIPDAALRAAQRLLDGRPHEQVWVAHGLVIAGLCTVLGVAGRYERLVPRFCEIRELPV